MADGANDDIPIDELNLSVRLHSALWRSGINTLSELCMMTDTQLLRVPNLGRKSLNEIKHVLRQRGLTKSKKYTEFDLEYFTRLQLKFDDMELKYFDGISEMTVERDLSQHKAECLYGAFKEINDIKGLPEPVYLIIRDAYSELLVIQNLCGSGKDMAEARLHTMKAYAETPIRQSRTVVVARVDHEGKTLVTVEESAEDLSAD